MEDDGLDVEAFEAEVARLKRCIRAAEVRQDRDMYRRAFEAGMKSITQQHEFLTFDSWFESLLEGMREGD